ncbi:hypothetical protein R69658_05843 [Paraburkholderia aspalathi]|uniref:Uncharacterized protein n=1 Tax=Paraburkholderia aspalathi TaxID=1324617 RepID=A0ABM8SMR1_9BURK|nr:hypothetical protein [Paraburkholderia aspalathi]MBK3822158.1 hypothetical protein [Paraburkholderia aspalathi]MBK3833992.1 hypothetical protein [Paraburkholderia aspalathi]MBK3863713.1 hypothetical protein [Paraburkholderia aspalathi]CAE6820884.1 hypothetical protein R69658_05843 [Paraburkholderia aspalathi]
MTTMTLTKSMAIALAIGGLLSGLLAAWFWERSTRVRVEPLGGDPYAIMPVEADLSNMWWWTAQFRANQEMARLNTLAARWTAAAVVLGTLSSVIGLL